MPRRNRGCYLRFIKERNTYCIQWSECGAIKKRSTGTSDHRKAEAKLAEFITLRNDVQPTNSPMEPERYSIAQALELYARNHAPTTAAPERIAYALKPLVNYWGDNSVASITKQNCRKYNEWRKQKPLTTRSKTIKPGTIRRELGALRAALNFAVSEGQLSRAPYVELPKKPSGKDRWLTKSEVAKLLNTARISRGDIRQYLPLYILIGLYTGARKSAILSLKWSQVDLELGKIDFNPVGVKKTSKKKVRGQPIPDRLKSALVRAKKRGDENGYVIHRNGKMIKDIGDSKSGSFGTTVKKVGLKDVSPHTLRHTCGTWMAQRGVPLFEIAGWLGQSYERTSELYAHHHSDYMDTAKRAADRRN